MRRASLALACIAWLVGGAALAQDLAVTVTNASKRTRCAETDNVYLKLQSREVRTFQIEAVHPPYLKDLKADTVAPDFKACDMTRDPVFRSAPRHVVLHDAGAWQLRGFAYETFWRPATVPVTVGERTETGLHLLQLWTRGRTRDEEVVVLYPADGYWRARVLAPEKLGWTVNPHLPTAYGSSFLVGPVEEKGRPFVDIDRIHFYPDIATFIVTFKRGGRVVLRVAAATEERTTLHATIDAVAGRPFAALRSMYVADDNADVARVAWHGEGKHGDAGVMAFKRAQATQLWTGRTKPSRHNTSAPDVIFRMFRAK
jgi:hypothetical protein